MKKALILMGIPGSGKSTFATDYRKNNLRIVHVEFDDYLKNRKYNSLEKNKAIEKIIYDVRLYNEIILDGLFLTNDEVQKLIDILKKNKFDKIEIHFWKPDVDICLWNDKYRRKEDSSITIKNNRT